MDAIVVEIHAAEGGADARDLVREQVGIYGRLCAKRGLVVEIADDRPNIVVLRVSGAGAAALFANEPGGHRWQRVPPTEKRGRTHTSTITVAVMQEPTEAEIHVDERDLEIKVCRGTGPGGQARNTTDSAVQIKHKPTGLIVRCDTGRSQHANKKTALALLRARLLSEQIACATAERTATRKAQVGIGARGDKRRTIRAQDGTVVDHRTGRRWRYQDYVRGDW